MKLTSVFFLHLLDDQNQSWGYPSSRLWCWESRHHGVCSLLPKHGLRALAWCHEARPSWYSSRGKCHPAVSGKKRSYGRLWLRVLLKRTVLADRCFVNPAEVRFRVKWTVFVSRCCYWPGPFKVNGQFSRDGIYWVKDSCKVCQQSLLQVSIRLFLSVCLSSVFC